MHRLQELVRLHRMGESARKVAGLLKMSPNTERRYREALIDAGLLAGSADALPSAEELKAAVQARLPRRLPPQQQSTVEPWRSTIEELLDKGLKPKAIFDRLRLQDSAFKAKLGAVHRMVRRIKRERGVQPQDVAIVVETKPGEVAQVDFGYAGKLLAPDGRLRRAWVFVMVLGHSRHMFARVVFDQKTETWLALHQEAFAAVGGVPATVVPDNLKAAVVRAAFGVDDESGLNRSYRELARHYGFKVDPTPPYSPQKKGKVEAGVKYVKRNALAGREGERIDDINAVLDRWVIEVAGQRVHGTTSRKPLEVFADEEQAALLPLPKKLFEPVIWKQAKVHPDSHVHFQRRLYSVPWRLVGKQVWLRATPTALTVRHDDERVATHTRAGRSPYSTHDAHLPDQRAALRHRSRDYWQQRADRLGEEVGLFVRELFDSDEVLSQLRKVQAVVTHLERHPRARANAACRRARYYGNLSYRAVRDILRGGLDFQPLPGSQQLPIWESQPRFARNINELLVTSPGGEA